MIRKSSKNIPGLRLYFFVLGAAFLFWLPFEGSQTSIPVLLACAVSLLWAARIWFSRSFESYKDLAWAALVGILAGLAVSPIAVILIFFKIGIHDHSIPDFTPAQILFVLRRTPLWGAAGLLIGLGIGIWRMLPAPEE